jgi:hypothetical protein
MEDLGLFMCLQTRQAHILITDFIYYSMIRGSVVSSVVHNYAAADVSFIEKSRTR